MKLIRKPMSEDEPISIGPFLFKLVLYWPLFFALSLLAVAAAWFYLQVTPPLYETTATMLLRDNKNQPQDTKSFEALDVISPKRSVDNEAEAIQSRDLIADVVQNLNLYAPVYEENKLNSVLIYKRSPIIVTTNDITTLKKTIKVYFSVSDSSVFLNNEKYTLNKLYRTRYGNLKFIHNPYYNDTAANHKPLYFSIIPPKKVVESISAHLTVTITNKQSNIIDLELKDQDPGRGEDILNTLIKFYNLSIEKEKDQLAANTEKFINDRITGIENDLLEIEHQQQTYRSNKGAIDISTQGKLYLENVSTNDQKTGEINVQLSVLKQIESYVKSKNLSAGIVPSTVGINDPGLTQMVKNIYELQLEVEGLKKTTGENNPLVVSYNDQIEKIRPQILENLENQRQSLLASKSNLSNTNQHYSSQLQAMPETEKKLIDINRGLNLKSDLYNYLLQKKEEAALSFISTEANSKIIESPQSSEFPVSPKGKFIYLGSLLIAFVLAISFVSVKESLRRKIMYYKEIESLTTLPIISEITAGKLDNPIVIKNNERTLIAEQFRRLRTTLSYLGIGGEKKRVLVTSAISGEGKSFIALNLAVSLSLTNKKVVLVDFDLSNPSLHTKLKRKKENGVTEFLKNEVSIDAIINQTDVNENLFFISAGNLPDNPTELITNGRPQELLNYLNKRFDFIIIDVPPVGPVSDAYILSPLCDATLYVIRHAYTPKIFVERIDKNNILNKLNNAAIIFNNVSSRSFSNYGYGYGYGYVYENQNDKKRLT
jgi:tyrosine-protein kinase Etk/Wzc